MIAEAEEMFADMRAANQRIEAMLQEPDEAQGAKRASINLTRKEITLIEAGLELLVDQAYEQINAIDDDISLDRSTKDDYIAGVQEALENQKAVLEKMTSHKQRLEEANAQE